MINFVQHVYGFRIRQIVIDFIKNAQGVFVITDVKNFTFDEYEKVQTNRSNRPKLIKETSPDSLFQKVQISLILCTTMPLPGKAPLSQKISKETFLKA